MVFFLSGLAHHGAALVRQVAGSCSLVGAGCYCGISHCSFGGNVHSFGPYCAICNGISHYD